MHQTRSLSLRVPGMILFAVLATSGAGLAAAATSSEPSRPGQEQQTTTEGWCCIGQRLERLAQRVCAAKNGRFFDNRTAAERACQGAAPPQPLGACCLNGRVQPLSAAECQARRGRFFERPEEAERACGGEAPREGMQAPPGACCLDGRVQPLSAPECQARRGRFFERPEEAERACRAPGPGPGAPPPQQPADLRPVVQTTARYRFRIGYSSGHVFEGEMDVAERTQHYTIAVDERGPLAEIFWDGELGVGRRLGSDVWFKLSGYPMIDLLGAASASLVGGEVIEVRRAGERTIHVLSPMPVGTLDPTTRQELASLKCCGETGRFFAMLDQLAAGLQSQVEIQVSSRDQTVRGYTVTVTGDKLSLRVDAEFAPLSEQVPRPPAGVTTGTPEVPANALALTIPTLGGWMDIKTHSPWVQRSLDLIESSDGKGEYAEIYGTSWGGGTLASFTEKLAASIGDKTYEATGADWFTIYNPIVLGAYHEDEADRIMPDFYKTWFADDDNYKKYQAKGTDYYWSSSIFRRDSHHYGAWADGLAWEWYFTLVPNMPSTVKNDRYYSARDWGYGANRLNSQGDNRLTFTEAIRQYNQYAESGKKRAYLMLGHPVHLLQDSGHPDHAAVVSHPASGMSQPEAFERFKYCEFVGAQASAAAAVACSALTVGAGICMLVACPSAYGLAYATCKQAADASLVGYERLVAESWRTKGWFGNKSGVDAAIDKAGPLPQKTYDAFFDDLGKYSKSKLSTYGLSNPVGCSSLTVSIGLSIDAANPAIDRYSQSDTLNYLKYSDDVLPRIIESSAGLIQHFYQIVNYPPFVERLALVQWEPKASPRGFATLTDDVEKYHCVRYDSAWQMSGSARTLKSNLSASKQKLSTDRPVYVFVRFGPSDIGPIKGGKTMASVSVEARKGSSQGTTITMKKASDADGAYYWGSFQPTNCSLDPYQLTFEITGSDGGPHLQTRTYRGDEIDSNPATVATADVSSPTTYPLLNYETGADTNHVVWVEAFSEEAEAVPATVELDPERFRASAAITAKMTGFDCHQEQPFETDPTCITGWKLDSDVMSVTQPGVTGSPESFGFAMELEDERAASTTLRFWLPPRAERRYTPGTYRVTLEAELAENISGKRPSVTIEVTLK